MPRAATTRLRVDADCWNAVDRDTCLHFDRSLWDLLKRSPVGLCDRSTTGSLHDVAVVRWLNGNAARLYKCQQRSADVEKSNSIMHAHAMRIPSYRRGTCTRELAGAALVPTVQIQAAAGRGTRSCRLR